MKIDKKGFLLAEVVIVSTVILTIMTTLYSSYAKMNSVYKIRNNYYNIDTLYSTYNLKNYLLDEMYLNEILSETNTNILTFVPQTDELFQALISSSNIESAYCLKKDKLDEFINNNDQEVTNTMKDYLNYLKSQDNYQTSNDHLLIVERLSDDNYYYSYVEL